MLTINKSISLAVLFLSSAGVSFVAGQVRDQHALFAATAARPATDDDVAEIIKLASVGFSDQLVVQQIRSEGKALLFSANQRNTLMKNGVDGNVAGATERLSSGKVAHFPPKQQGQMP
jgi:hypothetical protein